MSLDEEEIKMINRALEKKYDAELKEEAEMRKKIKENSPKLYLLIRRNISELSLKELAGMEWDEKELKQDPIEQLNSLKETHTAYSIGNPHPEKQALRQAYADLKMTTGTTTRNKKGSSWLWETRKSTLGLKRGYTLRIHKRITKLLRSTQL